MSGLVSLAAIHDKDNAHPLGVVGWRSEYHAMRAAIDAVLAEHTPNPYCIHQHEGAPCCEDCEQIMPCATVRAITEHIDVEPPR